jgi:hypothetical protein
MLSGKQEGGMTTLEEQAAAIVKGFEQERDDTLADSPELQRLVDLTPLERQILAHAAIRALRASGYEIVRSKNAHRT